jgi:hypothetical protein
MIFCSGSQDSNLHPLTSGYEPDGIDFKTVQNSPKTTFWAVSFLVILNHQELARVNMTYNI